MEFRKFYCGRVIKYSIWCVYTYVYKLCLKNSYLIILINEMSDFYNFKWNFMTNLFKFLAIINYIKNSQTSEAAVGGEN